MTHGAVRVWAAAIVGLGVWCAPLAAHHPIPAKFDDTKPLMLSGVVTLVDWRAPHVHVFLNVRGTSEAVNWAVELESPIELRKGGWTSESLQPGDGITVEGIAARNGSRQLWARSIALTGTGKRVFDLSPNPTVSPMATRPAPRGSDGRPRLGQVPGGASGYWASPSSTGLVESGANVPMDAYGLLKNIADAGKVAPFQPWALGLFVHRQGRLLRDDPVYLNCKPAGGPRQFQLPYGVQFVEDPDHQRIFVLFASSNANYRIIYLDGRVHAGQVGGDDDNPLYYGRSVAQWDGDTLVADTRGFNEDFWFTNGGLPHTGQLRLGERFSRPDYDTLRYDVTIDDLGAYTRPWSSGWTLRWVAGEELPLHLCQDNRP